MEFTIWPDLNAPLVPLVDDPSDWRAGVSGIGHYLQCTLADAPGAFAELPDHPHGVGENYYGALRDGHYYDQIGLPQFYESGIIKPWSQDGLVATDGILRALYRMHVEAHAPAVPTIVMDEPFTAAKAIGLNYDTCLDYVLRACETLQAVRNVVAIEFTEAMALKPLAPWFRSHEILTWTDRMRAAGVPLTALRLDISWHQLPVAHEDRLELRAVRNQCESWGLPLAVIATPGVPHDDASFCAGALAFADKIHDYFEGWPSRIDVASWEGKNRPPTLPASGPNTLVWLKDEIIRRIA